MKLLFLGTRGGITARSELHYMHSSLMITYRGTSILIDWGKDWLDMNPPPVAALFLTHGHPDHVGGLRKGFPAPVYASQETAKIVKRYPLKLTVVTPRQLVSVGSLTIEPFAVYHSVRAPALGYRVSSGKKTLFYVSDLIAIIDEKRALKDINLYIGDGAIITRTLLVRKKDGIPVGHVPIKEQLAWCRKNKVPCAIITHCGSEITKGDPAVVKRKIKAVAKGLSVMVAYDGLALNI